MKRNYLIVLILCGILFFLITMNPLFNFTSFSGELDRDLVISYGTIIGGLFGPILTLISFFIIYNSFQEQIKYNEEQKKYNNEQTVFNDKQMFLSNLNNDIKYLRDYVSTIKYREPGSMGFALDEEMGELYFIKAKMQLDKLFKIVQDQEIFIDERDNIGATFEIFYTGVGTNTVETLKAYLARRTTNDNVEKLINKIRKLKTKYNRKIVYYGGHQGKLGHYFRQLAYIYEKIEKCPLDIDKYEAAKSIRVKMSNYEQSILCYNSFTYLGKNWQDKGYIEKYKCICNIPQDFLPFNPKKYFQIEFEYETGL